MTVEDAVNAVSDQWLRDIGLSRERIYQDIEEIYTSAEKQQDTLSIEEPLTSLLIRYGTDKYGDPENTELLLKPGDTCAICGPTGSGKTRLLEDIEYISAGDSPSHRIISINGSVPSDEKRMILENSLCAYLAQTMNFVLDLSVHDFLCLHAKTRGLITEDSEADELIQKVMGQANRLSGEPFTEDTDLTQLSGGQSRALMIADIFYISKAPVVLIDEPENAGIDKEDIVSLFADSGRIVLISTHDPLIALSCPKRIIIRNGSIADVIERSEQEEMILKEIKKQNSTLKKIRQQLRRGERL